ncbi:MAG: hypothetical protein ACFBSC_15135 [Microcoleaceae cyanobacterium]
MGSKGKEHERMKARLLLNLWDQGGLKTEIKRTDLLKRVKLSREKVSTYQGIIDELTQEAAITTTTQRNSVRVSLTATGLNLLQSLLYADVLEYSPRQRVRTKDFNALLHWMREHQSQEANDDQGQVSSEKDDPIDSYRNFQTVALLVYDQLNNDYNYDNFVPIYRIRREIGEQVSRAQFNEWMLEMQADDFFQFQGGSIEDGTADKIADSISTELSGLRCYAKRLKP